MAINDWGLSDETVCGGTPDDACDLEPCEICGARLPLAELLVEPPPAGYEDYPPSVTCLDQGACRARLADQDRGWWPGAMVDEATHDAAGYPLTDDSIPF